MTTPRVSIVIPTYNRAHFLNEAIESVRSQTVTDWELIVIDDGSIDSTSESLASLMDPRIKVIRQDNMGVAAARNRGAREARASLIAFLDSDDLWLPQKLKIQLDHFEANAKSSICQTEEIWVRHGRRVNPAMRHAKKSGWIFKDCIPLCIISPSAVMIRKDAFDALGGFDENFAACEDYDLWLRAALRYEITTLSDALIIKRGGHADQLSRQSSLDRLRIMALEKILDDPMLPEDMRPLVRHDIARRAAIVALGAKKRGSQSVYEEYERKRLAYAD